MFPSWNSLVMYILTVEISTEFVISIMEISMGIHPIVEISMEFNISIMEIPWEYRFSL